MDELLALVRLEGLGARGPTQLSGGQPQRVALARALAPEPKVLLLDEPLSALDLKLRQQMQLELRAIQRRLGATFIYVTHDQTEALAMSDRIAVMNDGRIEQLGTPREIYTPPASVFVSDFIGETQPDPARHDRRARRGDGSVLVDRARAPRAPVVAGEAIAPGDGGDPCRVRPEADPRVACTTGEPEPRRRAQPAHGHGHRGADLPRQRRPCRGRHAGDGLVVMGRPARGRRPRGSTDRCPCASVGRSRVGERLAGWPHDTGQEER